MDRRRPAFRTRSPSGPEVRHGLEPALAGSRLAELAERAQRLAVEVARKPLKGLLVLLVLNLGIAACFVPAGLALGDQALFFREGMPGTWLSFAQLLFIAAAAAATHRRALPGAPWRRGFFGLSAAIFLVFAFDEITQAGLFLAHALRDGFGLAPASGFNDLDSVLLVMLFAASGLVLAPKAGVLRAHPLALALLVVGAAAGAGSQMLDSFIVATRWEFVAEETLKLSAEAFFVGGFLCALRDVLERPAAATASPDAGAARPAA
jgi:hypothetical protein